MPRLPDQNALPLVIPRASRGVVRREVVPLGLERAGGELLEAAYRKEDYTVTKAAGEFVRKEIAARNIVDGMTREEGESIEEFEERYQNEYDKAMGGVAESAASSMNPRMRANYEQAIQSQQLHGQQQMFEGRKKHRQQYYIAETNKDIEAARTSYLTAKTEEDREQVILNIHKQIDDTIASGAITPDQGGQLKRETAKKFAIAGIKAMPVDEQLAYLEKGEGMVKMLDPDEVTAMQTDAVTLKRVEENHAYTQLQRQRAERADMLMNTIQDAMYDDDPNTDALATFQAMARGGDLNGLDPETREHMRKFAEGGGHPVVSDPRFIHAVESLDFDTRQKMIADGSFAKYAPGLSKTDYTAYMKRGAPTIDGSSRETVITSAMRRAGITIGQGAPPENNVLAGKLTPALDESIQTFYDEKGRNPTAPEMNKMADELTVQIITGEAWGSGGPQQVRYMFEFSQEVRSVVPPEDLDLILEAMADNDIEPTDQGIVDAYYLKYPDKKPPPEAPELLRRPDG